MSRIKFYGLRDLSIGWYYKRLSTMIEFPENNEPDHLINILEIHNALKFIENGLYPEDISDTKIKYAQKNMQKRRAKFFNDLTKEDLEVLFNYMFNSIETINMPDTKGNKVDTDLESTNKFIYKEDFIECYEYFKLSSKFDEASLDKCLNDYSIPIHYLLKSDYFIKNYSELIKNKFLGDSDNIELLLSNYAVDGTKYKIPKNISKIEMYNLCHEYIERTNSGLNFLVMISRGIKGIAEFEIDAKLKLKAQRKITKIEDEMFYDQDGNRKSGMKFSIKVFSDEKKYQESNAEFKTFIDVSFIENNKDEEILIGYIMYLDYFFTNNWILNLCSFPNLETTTISRVLEGIKTRRHYDTNFYFENKNILFNLTIRGFQDTLKDKHKMRIEDLIVNYFSNVIKKYYKIDWDPFYFANEAEKLDIQIKNIFTIEENIRKQWKILLQDGYIDSELIELETTPPIESLSSLLSKKYIYQNFENDNIISILNLLFSDQSHIIYINEEINDRSFLTLILKNKLKISDFLDYQKLEIIFLKDNKIISIDAEGSLYLTEKQLLRALILKNIYNYGVIHYYHYLEQDFFNEKKLVILQNTIDEMIEDGLLIFENSLFSRPESEFLDYLLNNSRHDNALALRNKYLHGSINKPNEQDYYYSLIVLILYVVKINDELEIVDNLNS